MERLRYRIRFTPFCLQHMLYTKSSCGLLFDVRPASFAK